MATIKKITIEDVMEALRKNASTDWEEDFDVPYVYYFLHLDSKGIKPDYWCATDDSVVYRTSVESYVDELICDVELPAAAHDDDDDYDDCDEDWMIKLCVRYGVTAYRDLDWSTIVAEIEEREDGIFACIAEDLADEANAWLEEQADNESAALSIDNGETYIEAGDEDALQSAIDTIGWDGIVSRMDDDAREQTHSDVSPCTELEYLKHYLEIAPCDLVIG